MAEDGTQRRMQVERLELSALVTVPDEVIEFNVGYLPEVLGDNLADQAGAFAELQGMGYYPALDYFRDRPDVVDPALLNLTDEVAGFCTRFAEQAFRRRLVRAFASVTVLDSRCTCYGMPRVRPTRRDALAQLAEHYSPRSVRLQLVVSAVGRNAEELTPEQAGQAIDHWLGEVFTRLEVSPHTTRAAG